MGEPLILALDQGTTSTRAILFTADGRALAEAGSPLEQFYPQDGWVEHDAEEIFRESVKAMRAAIDKSGRPLADVAAIGITNQRETVVLWEKSTGRPVHRAIVWQDRRTEPLCAELRAAGREARITELTGLLVDPYFSGTKLGWLLDHVPGARAAAARGELLAGTIDAWVIWKLTGGRVHATDATNASRTLLYDLREGAWSAEMSDLLGVPLDIMPQVIDCAGDYGETDPSFLGRAIPVRGVAGDQQAALMGQGCIHPGEMKATYGTGCFMLLNTGETAPLSKARLLTTVAAQIGGRTTYALEGAIFIAGAAIQWVEQLGVTGGPRAVEALAQRANDDLGVVLVPAFTGLGAPWWDANARGGLFGLTRDAGMPEIARAAFDAAALQTRDLIEAMRADAPQAFHGEPEIRIDGGMARSAWFSQRLSDLTGVGVCRATFEETTALGAALFAGVGAGVFRDVAEAAGARPKTESYTPRLEVDRRERAYARWLDAVNRVGSR